MNPTQLKAERKQRGWSQTKVAEALGVNLSTVRRWERGRAVPYPYYRKKLAALFGKTTQELGLFSDAEDNDIVEETLSPTVQSATSDVLMHKSLLLDPTIPQSLGNANSLQGHDSLLMEAKQRLLAGDNLTLTALGGLPGIGKTSLAVVLATDPEIQAHFRDGILWAGLGPRPKLLVQFAHWGNLLGVLPSQMSNIESRTAWNHALRATIGTRQMLLVIDDAWTAEDALALQVGGPACAHLLTTRLPQVALAFDQEGATVIPQLEDADGLALLASFIPQLVEQDPQGARALVWAMGGLPLTLTLIGKYLASHFQSFTQQSQPLQAVLELLQDTERHLDESVLTPSGQHAPSLVQTMPPSLHATITICDQQLNFQAHTALCALAFFPPKPHSFSEEAALAASQQPEETLDTLREVGLLETYGPGRYTLHQAVVNYARAQSEFPTAQQQQVSSLVMISQSERDTHTVKYPLFAPSLRGIRLRHTKSIPTFRASNRFSRHPLLTGSMILLAVLLIAATLPTFTGLLFLRREGKQHIHIQKPYGPPSYSLIIQNTDPSLNNTTQRFQNVFKAVYAQLVNRFAFDSASAANNTITLTFSSDLASPAQTSGTTITINSDWMKQHPNDMGLLTHQLTLAIEQYPSGAPAWFSDGIADYARYVYGPADDDDWSLPNDVQPKDSYKQGGKVTARFLLWLEQHTRLDIVDQLNHALQTQQPFSDAFHILTDHTVDDLWNQYKKQPNITLTPYQLYNTAMSRKPLYQSSFHLISSSPYFSYAQGLYLSNFAMQADITIISGDGGAGFYFRNSVTDTNWYGIYLFTNGSANGKYRLDHTLQPGTATFSPAIKVGLNQTNRLTIIVQKQTIYLYINSQFIQTQEMDADSSSSYGTVGVSMTKYNNSPNMQFENVQVF